MTVCFRYNWASSVHPDFVCKHLRSFRSGLFALPQRYYILNFQSFWTTRTRQLTTYCMVICKYSTSPSFRYFERFGCLKLSHSVITNLNWKGQHLNKTSPLDRPHDSSLQPLLPLHWVHVVALCNMGYDSVYCCWLEDSSCLGGKQPLWTFNKYILRARMALIYILTAFFH